MFGLGHLAAIFDFTNNAMSKVTSDHTTRSGIPENLIVDTKIMKLLLFCHFEVCPWPNGGHLGKWPISAFRCKLNKTPSRMLMLEVSYIQINRQNLCLKRCIRDFMAGPGLLLHFSQFRRFYGLQLNYFSDSAVEATYRGGHIPPTVKIVC